MLKARFKHIHRERMCRMDFSNVRLSMSDILYVALLAFVITWVIQNISKNFKLIITKPAEINYNQTDVNKIIQRCYGLFPRDIISFQGKTFKRGMNVRITTNQKKIFEGRLIGQNSENMLCVLTNKYVVAQDIENIDEIIIIES